MKKVLLASLVCSLLVSCHKETEAQVICPMASVATFLPEKLPNLNLNPDYLNFEDRFNPDENDQDTIVARFETTKNSTQADVKLNILRHEAGVVASYTCTQSIDLNDFEAFVNVANSAEICKDPSLSSMGDQCVQVSSALSPQVFQARENNEMHSVALNLGSYNAQKYFCNRSTVIDFENLIKNIYAHLSLQNDCAKDN